MPSITLTFTNPQAQRLAVALQEALELDAPATPDDLKAYIIRDVKQLVKNAEKAIADRARVVDPDVEIT